MSTIHYGEYRKPKFNVGDYVCRIHTSFHKLRVLRSEHDPVSNMFVYTMTDDRGHTWVCPESELQRFEVDFLSIEDTGSAVPRSILERVFKKCEEEAGMTTAKKKPGWSIKQVIFNDPATIVLWTDGTKTVVKCENEVYDPEKGLAMALSKKMLGNQGNYFDVFRKWLPKDYETPSAKKEAEPWKIWYREFKDGKCIASGVYIKSYKRKNDATRVANKVYGDESKYQFIVSMANPWKEG